MIERKLERLGQQVAASLDTEISEESLLYQRQAFFEEVSRKRSSGSPKMVWLVAAMLAVALGVGMWQWQADSSLTFQVGDEQAPAEIGRFIDSGSSPLPIAFTQGSRMVLSPGSSGRMVRSDMGQVQFDLAGGAIQCHIVGNHKTSWIVSAGPYRVQVTGTMFEVSWNGLTKAFDVSVSRGSVLVSGATLSSHGIALVKGDHLTVQGNRAVLANEDKPTGSSVKSNRVADVVAKKERKIRAYRRHHRRGRQPFSVTGATGSTGASATEATGSTDEGWLGAYERGAYGQVVEMVKEEGVDAVLSSSGPGALWKLAKAARYGRDGRLAKGALDALESRFPNSPLSLSAAFVQGRVALELNGDKTSAVAHFERYLKRAPNGSLAQEATGRLLELYYRSGQHGPAHTLAQQYLSRYPNGTYADLARKLMNR